MAANGAGLLVSHLFMVMAGSTHIFFEEEEDEVAAPYSQVDQNLAYSSSIQPSERYIVPPRLLRHRILNLDLPRMRRWRSYCDGYTIIVPAG